MAAKFTAFIVLFGPPASEPGTSGSPEEITKAEKSLEVSTLSNELSFPKQTHFPLMVLVSRKVEPRTTNKFKLILCELMKETEYLAKSISEELGEFCYNS